jgi:D-citramalate synthase
MEKRKIEIMDTTLRDGEQTSGVSFSAAEKLTIAQLLLEELHIDLSLIHI